MQRDQIRYMYYCSAAGLLQCHIGWAWKKSCPWVSSMSTRIYWGLVKFERWDEPWIGEFKNGYGIKDDWKRTQIKLQETSLMSVCVWWLWLESRVPAVRKVGSKMWKTAIVNSKNTPMLIVNVNWVYELLVLTIKYITCSANKNNDWTLIWALGCHN